MTIPSYQELMRPVLDVGREGPIRVADLLPLESAFISSSVQGLVLS